MSHACPGLLKKTGALDIQNTIPYTLLLHRSAKRQLKIVWDTRVAGHGHLNLFRQSGVSFPIFWLKNKILPGFHLLVVLFLPESKIKQYSVSLVTLFYASLVTLFFAFCGCSSAWFSVSLSICVSVSSVMSSMKWSALSSFEVSYRWPSSTSTSTTRACSSDDMRVHKNAFEAFSADIRRTFLVTPNISKA